MKKFIITGLKFILPLSFGIFLIWYVYKDLTGQQKDEIFNSFAGAKYGWVLLSLSVGILSHLIRAIRWNILIEPLGKKPRIANSFSAVMVGYLANFAFPRLGEVLRCGILARYEIIPIEKLVGTVIIERASDVLLTIFLSAIVVAMQFDTISGLLIGTIGPFMVNFKANALLTSALIAGLIIASIAFLWFIRNSKFFEAVKKFLLGIWEGIKTIGVMKRRKEFIVYTFVIWFLYYAMFHIGMLCLEQTAGVSFGGALAAFVMGGYAIIFVQGGIGAFPLFVMKTLALYQVPDVFGYSFGWILWSGQTITIIIIGVMALVLLPVINKKFIS